MNEKLQCKTLKLILLILTMCVSGFAQVNDQDLKKEIEDIKQGQQMIWTELQEIKALIKAGVTVARPSGPNVRDVEFNLGENFILGEITAPLTLVEFTDYQ